MTCKSCVAGFYRLEEKCVACPRAAYMLVLVYVGAIGAWTQVAQRVLYTAVCTSTGSGDGLRWDSRGM